MEVKISVDEVFKVLAKEIHEAIISNIDKFDEMTGVEAARFIAEKIKVTAEEVKLD